MDLTNPIYADPEKAREHMEAIRWPDGTHCPHCGCTGKIRKLAGKSTRPGVYKCNDCKSPFTVTVGTVFERSKVPLNKWVFATHLMASSKKGMSAHQLHRTIGVTYKTAWFMFHRIREAMRNDSPAVFGGGGGEVEVDETFIGNDRSIKPKNSKKGRGYAHKHKVLALVDRSTGRARSMVVDDLKAKMLVPILKENIAKEATVYTDEAGWYKGLGREFANHGFVHHAAKEWGRGPVHTNTIEGYFSIFKRGMKGVYQHCAKKHLHRYAAEFEFRYNNRAANGVDDAMRANAILLIRDSPLGKAYVLGTFLTREVTDMGFKVASRVRGLSDEAFREAFGAEEQCRSALSRLRWPDGFVCPACGHRGHCVLAGRSLYQCNRCKKQTSSTAGTIFHATKLPLTLWFAAVHLIVTAKNGISSVELGRRLGVKQPTA